jgi:hypothetical protein
LKSSSYTPQVGDKNYEPMIAGLRRIFAEHQVEGKVGFAYDTRVFYGILD